MADYLPQNSGLWSTTTWITAFSNLTAFAGGNTPPTVIDDVYADGKTITIDLDVSARSIRTTTAPRTGGLAGGSFRINNAISLSANILAGSTSCLTFLSAAPNFCTIYGNVSGSTTTSNQNNGGVLNNSNGIINLFGSCFCGTVGGGGAPAVVMNSGTINVVGNVDATRGTGTTSYGIRAEFGSTFISVTGNIIGGGGEGVRISSGSTILNLLGNCTQVGSNYSLHAYFGGTINVMGSANGIGLHQNGGSGARANVVGDVRGLSIGSRHGISSNGTSTINVTGSVYGGIANNTLGILNNNNGSVFISGNVFGGAGFDCYGVSHLSIQDCIIIGNVTGGTGASSHGAFNRSSYVFNIQGNAIGGTGSGAYGAVNGATGYMEVNGIAIGNGWGLGSSGIGGAAPGIFGSQTGTTIIRGLSCGPRGQWPTAGNVFIIPQSISTATFETSAFQDVTLFTALSTNIVPPASSVRQGTVYNLGDYTGTCSIPSISSVQESVAVDNSLGIACLRPQQVWNVQTSAVDTNLLGGRLKEQATIQSFGQLLTAFNL